MSVSGPLLALSRVDRAAFAAAEPFPHVVLDGFLESELADRVADEFVRPGVAWKAFHHVNERKAVASVLSSFGPATRAVIDTLQGDAFRQALSELVGMPDLVADPSLDGSGLHLTEDGGFLNVHADHLSHTTHRSWSRRVNLLLFLNRGWQAAWGGQLELWSADMRRCVQRIEPGFNRCVVFPVSRTTYHGVVPVRCPSGRVRKSIAVYYFHDEGRSCRLAPTKYVARPEDPLPKRLAIRLDRWAVAAYSALKRYTPIDDAFITKLLRKL
jgi:Rps23 Pro-64 3,4-dihydroxylase Tpa1-like proline 4-hydroxylase